MLKVERLEIEIRFKTFPVF